mgnify:CR=1 FL=1
MILMATCLGKQDFGRVTFEYQEDILANVKSGGPDTLILFEPNRHTYAEGARCRRRPDEEKYRISLAEIQEFADVYEVSRGGHVTYHGPGQIVGYLITDIKRRGGKKFREELEGGLRNAAHILGAIHADIISERMFDPRPGVERETRQYAIWHRENGQDNKLAAIGIGMPEPKYTNHGFAFNVSPQLEMFEHIYPCGFTDKGATSLSKILGRDIVIGEVQEIIAQEVAKSLGYESVQTNSLDLLSK